ncbi:MAG: serine hydrolase domain-containing protein [bacterium]
MNSFNLKTIIKPPFPLALILALVLFACKMSIVEPVETPKNAWDESLNTHPRGAAFQNLLDDYIASGFPGLVMFVKSPEGMWNGAAGYARLETKERMTPAHLFPSGSNGKPYTAAAVMLLVEDGKIELDTKINQYLPRRITDKIGNGNTATVRQLLNHTSGIKHFFDEITLWLDMMNGPTRSISTEYFLELIYGDPPYFPAGQGYHYSSTNYVLLALIMDHVLGESHAKFVSERIIRPLRLVNTYYKNEPGYPDPPGLVNVYADLRDNGQLQNISDVLAAGLPATVGTAGYIASSYDYARFFEALLDGELVSEASLNAMTTDASGGGYGFGLWIANLRYGKLISHDGATVGAQTNRLYYVDRDTYIVLLANGIGSGEEGRLDDLFDNLRLAAEDAVFK